MSLRTIWNKISGSGGKKGSESETSILPERLGSNLSQNKQLLQDIFRDCADVVFHAFQIAQGKTDGLLIYAQGLVDKKSLNDNILRALVELDKRPVLPPRSLGEEIIYFAGQETATEIAEITEAILTGKTALLFEGTDSALLFETTQWEQRAIDEPKTEISVRGPRDSFIETLQTNIALIRRRIKDPRMKILYYPIGRRSKTKVALLYFEGLTPDGLLRETQNRLERIDMDIILDSGYVEQMIEDKWHSIFSQLQLTERPDEVVAALAEGRVAILTDTSPGVLIAPATLNSLMHSTDDYYNRWIVGSFVRGFRFFASIFSVILPSLYVALTSFHPELIPTQLALNIAATRHAVVFPSFVEAFLLEAFIELIREAGLRLPGNLGQAISIVGGLIIGQAAVDAGLVSPMMLSVVGLTAISNFTIPNFDAAQAVRVIRFLFMILATILGLYGIVIGSIFTFAHLATLKSFGYSYLSPWSPLEPADLKDSVIRLPWPTLKRRPNYLDPKQAIRQSDERRDNQSKS